MLWPPAISESSQLPVSGTSEAGASWPGGTEFPQQIQKKKQGHSAQGGILRPFLRGWVGSVAVHVRPRSGGTYRRADLEMGRVQPEEGCLCCPGVLPTAPWGQGHFLCL